MRRAAELFERPPTAHDDRAEASINAEEVFVSPLRFGAGPVSLVVANETSAAQKITFETPGGAAGLSERTEPIDPGDTATLKADVPPGRAIVRVQGDGIDPARLSVMLAAGALTTLIPPHLRPPVRAALTHTSVATNTKP